MNYYDAESDLWTLLYELDHHIERMVVAGPELNTLRALELQRRAVRIQLKQLGVYHGNTDDNERTA